MSSRKLLPVRLAEAIGMSKAAASAILSGRSSPGPETRIAIEVWTVAEVPRGGWDDAVEPGIRRKVAPYASPAVQS